MTQSGRLEGTAYSWLQLQMSWLNVKFSTATTEHIPVPKHFSARSSIWPVMLMKTLVRMCSLLLTFENSLEVPHLISFKIILCSGLWLVISAIWALDSEMTLFDIVRDYMKTKAGRIILGTIKRRSLSHVWPGGAEYISFWPLPCAFS